jgi:integrase
MLTDRESAINKGREPEIVKIQNHTFNELKAEYIKWTERQRGFKNKLYLINQLSEVFGNLPLRRFTTMLIEQYQTERLHKSKRPKNGKPDTGNKPATVNRLIATLSHMFTKAVDWNMVEEGVLKRIRKVKMLPENNRRLRYLSKEECKELVNSSEPHLKPILITALNTGMRKGEILNLQWNDNVDLKHGFILLGLTKNGDRREIPINNTLRSTLQAISRRLDTPYVFYDPKTGKPYKDVKRSFKTAVRRAKIHDFKFHDTRHTFASHLVMAGVDITTIKELLGHKTLTMTLRYAHLAPAHKTKAVDLLDSTLNGKTISTKLAQFGG